jgi:hypothetical protein
MLERIRQWWCSHRYDLADLKPRGADGMVSCRCYRCQAVHTADRGLHLPGVLDRNSNTVGPRAEGGG